MIEAMRCPDPVSDMNHIEADVLARNPWVTRRPLTVSEYHRMGEAGILTEDDRVELIEGQIIAMAPIGSDHSGTVNGLARALILAIGDRGVVAVQNPIRLDDFNEPQPDFSVLRPREDDYRRSIPRPEDVLLVIEIANSSLRYDRRVKLPLYARHGIPEVWIVDLAGRQVEVFRRPVDEAYTEVSRAGPEGSLPLLLTDAVLSVSAILG